MERRYGVLRFVAGLHKVMAVLAVLIGGFLGQGIVRTYGATTKAWIAGLPFLGGGVILALVLWAIAGTILVVVDIEANTRRTADAVARRESDPEPGRTG